MSREFLHAYLKAQAAHRSMHRLCKAFEIDSSDTQILSHLAIAQALLEEIQTLMKR
jgi:hypothetical protein